MLDPVSAQDSATKNYVDTAISGISLATDRITSGAQNLTISSTQLLTTVPLNMNNQLINNYPLVTGPSNHLISKTQQDTLYRSKNDSIATIALAVPISTALDVNN